MTPKPTSESDAAAACDPAEGLRLVKAFRRINNLLCRQNLLEVVEEVARQSEDRLNSPPS
jgi:hypothetical protein